MNRKAKQNTTSSIAIVVFAMNEEDAVDSTVSEVLEFVQSLDREWELILVDDGSTDTTGAIMDEWAQRNERIKALHHETNLGIGAALKTGYKNASSDLVVPLPADGQIDPGSIGVLIDALGHSDMVLSSYTSRGDGFLRSALSTGFSSATRIITGIDPRTHGFYLVRKYCIDEINPRSDTFFYNIELPILAIRRGMSVSVVSVAPRKRKSGRSKIFNIKRLARVVGELAALRVRMSRDRLMGIMGAFIW